MLRWRPIYGYEDRYYISNYGQVISFKQFKARILKLRHFKGYMGVVLYHPNGKSRTHMIHRLVANAFIGESPSDVHQVNHLDGNKSNNHVKNLEWVTPSENVLHSIKTGLRVPSVGEQHGRAKLTWEQVNQIRSMKRSGCGWKRPTLREIGKQFGVTHTCVFKILNNQRWTEG